MAFVSEDGADFAAEHGALPQGEKFASAPVEDALLVSAARDGDRAAFGRLYERYARMVHGVLLSKVPLNDVNDLLQDVFMIALRRLSTLREAGSFGAWLVTIARNRANDFHRRSAPEEQLEEEAPEPEIEAGDADRRDQALAILNAIRSLSEAYQETLILRLVEGMTGPEIAARTGLSHGSVRVNLHRGMQQLRAKLNSSVELDSPQQETR
jgi:RNA polymerase sigma-70 factor (ECF subfamily)